MGPVSRCRRGGGAQRVAPGYPLRVSTIRVAVAIAAGLVLAASVAPTNGAGQEQLAAAVACPEVGVLELLHDAMFFLEHRRDLSRVTQDLKEIRRRMTPETPGRTMVLGFTERIAALAARDGALEPESESIRAEVHASPCLTSEAHKRFHRALPPLP